MWNASDDWWESCRWFVQYDAVDEADDDGDIIYITFNRTDLRVSQVCIKPESHFSIAF